MSQRAAVWWASARLLLARRRISGQMPERILAGQSA
jgi:hypothetical protein